MIYGFVTMPVSFSKDCKYRESYLPARQEMGYQVEHDLPPEILNSWQYLVDQGFNLHRMESAHSHHLTQPPESDNSTIS